MLKQRFLLNLRASAFEHFSFLLWRAFWANCKLLCCRRASLESRLKAWDCISSGILEYRCTRWPPTKTAFKLIDGVQSKIVSKMVDLRPNSGEDAATFCLRRGRATATAIKKHSRTWSLRWATRVQSWLEHTNRHPETPSGQLLRCQDGLWLMERRRASAHRSSQYTLFSGLTGTRAGAGRPVRWLDDSWGRGHDCANPGRHSHKTQKQALALHLRITGH